MDQYQDIRLDATFQALADRTRRTMVAQLGRYGVQSAGELAAPHAMSLQAALKHIRVLMRADLVTREKIGRTVQCRLNAAHLRQAVTWIEDQERFWSERLDALAEFVERDES